MNKAQTVEEVKMEIKIWAIAAIVTIALGIFFLIVSPDVLSIIVIVLGLAMVAFPLREAFEKLPEAKRREAEQNEEKRKNDEILHKIRKGTYEFPTENFYCLCRDNHITTLDNEFAIKRAALLAVDALLMVPDVPYVSETDCMEYTKLNKLKEYLKVGEARAKKAEALKIIEQKKPCDGIPTTSEKIFIKRASDISYLSGYKKRERMLTNLIADYNEEIHKKEEGQKALMQLGMIYANQQQKESDWAIIGGIAQGIAGPAAGIMAASETMANNSRIREHNAAMRKASMEIMSGLPNISGNIYELEKERDKIKLKLIETNRKVVLSKPDANQIWKNVQVGKAAIKKNPSGVLVVALPITIKEAFVLDVPDGVCMVMDGTIKGEVWFEDKLVGDVIFPLPLYGIPTNMTAEVTLDGMCGRSVEFDGEYTVKIADDQNLWIMEA